MNDQLRRAMDAADLAEIDTIGSALGVAAVQTALAVREEPEHPRDDPVRVKQLQEAAEQRQRDVDAALSDTIDTVTKHRARVGRKTWTAQDGATIRKIFELLRGLTPGMDE
jgi:hypothetical protein